MSDEKSLPLLDGAAPSSPPPLYTPASHGQATASEKAGPGPRRNGPPPPRPMELPALLHLRNSRTILASQSPRRAALLSTIGIRPEIKPSAFEENLDKTALSPYEYVLETARSKCLDVYKTCLREDQQAEEEAAQMSKTDRKTAKRHRAADVIIAADTVIVSHDGRVLEKPRSEREHVETLMSLRDSGISPSAVAAGSMLGKMSLAEKVVDEDEEQGSMKLGYRDSEPSEGEVARVAAEANYGLGGGVRGEALGAMGQNLSANDGSASHGRPNQTGWHRVFTAVAVLMPLESLRAPGYALETHVEETGVRFDPMVSDEMILSYVKTREGADKAGGYGIQGLGVLLVERIDGCWDNVVGMPLRATVKLVESVMKKIKEDVEEDEEDLLEQFGDR